MISQQKYRGKVSYKEIKSINWLHQKNYTIPLVLEKDNINLDIRSSKESIKVITGEKKPKYTINVKTEFAVIQNENNVSTKSMQTKISKKIKKEIVRTIKKGAELQADPLNISEKAYRYHSKEWDTKTINNFNLDSINDIKVNVNIIGSKSYKR